MSIPCFFSFQMYSPFQFFTLSVFSHVRTVETILLFSLLLSKPEGVEVKKIKKI